jgi:hypothetical protein
MARKRHRDPVVDIPVFDPVAVTFQASETLAQNRRVVSEKIAAKLVHRNLNYDQFVSFTRRASPP